MRILLLAQWYPPIIGGEENHVAGLAAGLARMGHEVRVGTLRQPGLPAVEVRDGIMVHRLPGTLQRFERLFTDADRRSASPFPDPETAIALARFSDDFRPDVVHAHNWLVHSWLPLKATNPAPLVVSLHDYSLVCAKKNLIRKGALCDGPALAKCLRCAAHHYGAAKGTVTVTTGFVTSAVERAAVDLFLPVSAAVRDGVGLADHERVQVIPNFVQPVDPVPADELARMTDQLPDSPFLLFVGAFSRQKGIDHLRSAFEAANLPVPLVLIGYSATDAPSWLGRRQENVHVMENWPRAAVVAAMERSLATVVPSVWREPCPTVGGLLYRASCWPSGVSSSFCFLTSKVKCRSSFICLASSSAQ